ncbi:HAMP domain-containing protein [Synechocystis sp. B12]|nr:HAMP domain-containing protein [Synechocystis sp. B12]
MKNTVDNFDGGYSAVYYIDPNGEIQLATSNLKTGSGQNTKVYENVAFPDLELLKKAQENPDMPLVGRTTVEGEPLTVGIKVIKDIQGQPLALLVRGTSEVEFNDLLERTLLLQIGVGAVALLVAAIIAYWLGKTLTKPLKNLQTTAQKLGEGETGVRAEVESKDEVGQLAVTFNAMAEQVEASTRSLQETSLERQQEAEKQRQLKEELQDGVVRLLTDIEESSRGDLTVRSSVEAGA